TGQVLHRRRLPPRRRRVLVDHRPRRRRAERQRPPHRHRGARERHRHLQRRRRVGGGRLPPPDQGRGDLRLRDPEDRRGRRPGGDAQADHRRRAHRDRRARDARPDPLRAGPPQDPQRQDHAPHPPPDRARPDLRPRRRHHARRPQRREADRRLDPEVTPAGRQAVGHGAAGAGAPRKKFAPAARPRRPIDPRRPTAGSRLRASSARYHVRARGPTMDRSQAAAARTVPQGDAMGLFSKLRGELVDIIEWIDDTRQTLVWRFPRYQNEIKNGAQLIVRPGQTAVFVNQGKIADVFEPGHYQLTTQNLPILSTLMGWKYGFDSPFKAEVYFLTTRQVTDLKWGTPNPIMLRDPDFGPIRLRAFGPYALTCADAKILLKELVGTDGVVDPSALEPLMRSVIATAFTDLIGKSQIAALDLARNYQGLSEGLRKEVLARVDDEYGLDVPMLALV